MFNVTVLRHPIDLASNIMFYYYYYYCCVSYLFVSERNILLSTFKHNFHMKL